LIECECKEVKMKSMNEISNNESHTEINKKDSVSESRRNFLGLSSRAGLGLILTLPFNFACGLFRKKKLAEGGGK
jgi:hypothetical protein